MLTQQKRKRKNVPRPGSTADHRRDSTFQALNPPIFGEKPTRTAAFHEGEKKEKWGGAAHGSAEGARPPRGKRGPPKSAHAITSSSEKKEMWGRDFSPHVNTIERMGVPISGKETPTAVSGRKQEVSVATKPHAPQRTGPVLVHVLEKKQEANPREKAKGRCCESGKKKGRGIGCAFQKKKKGSRRLPRLFRVSPAG